VYVQAVQRDFRLKSYLVAAASSRNGKERQRRKKGKIGIQMGRQQKIKGVEWRKQDKLEAWIG
jgi:hypothetical protein